LTRQPIPTKLRPIRHMQKALRKILLVMVVLATLFVAARCDYCGDFNQSSNSHFCPFCTPATSAAVPSPIAASAFAFGPMVTGRMEIPPATRIFPSNAPRLIPPRAPPAV